jgi:acetyl esterase/lipase
MPRVSVRVLLGLVILADWGAAARAGDAPVFTRKEDVVYGHKYGTALTMDVFAPKHDANGAAVIFTVSGGWFSSRQMISLTFCREFLKRGYTVFAVMHGSQPKYTIPEIIEDMNRAVRFIRYHAADYGIDPNRIGITGGSAGGHLSLMMGAAGNDGDPKGRDAIDGVSSRVQAVACFFPPSDFMNYGEKGVEALGTGRLSGFKAPFDFEELDPKTRSFVRITDPEKRREFGRRISPVNHVTASAAPTLIIHGDADQLVPIQQAEVFIAKLKEVGVPCELIVKHGARHGWQLDRDMPSIADWFDKYLGKTASKPASAGR